MEGKRNRGEVTAELSAKVWARLCRENALVASEVWVDDARRVDFVAYRPHRPRDRSSNHATAAELESGTFTFVEVKSCMDDFTSGHGRTFEGDENWLVCPLELADSLASKGMLPKGRPSYSPRRPRRPAEALRHFRIPAGARRPGNRADMGDAEAESSCETGAGFPVTRSPAHLSGCISAHRHTYAEAHTRTRIYTHQHQCTYARTHKT